MSSQQSKFVDTTEAFLFLVGKPILEYELDYGVRGCLGSEQKAMLVLYCVGGSKVPVAVYKSAAYALWQLEHTVYCLKIRHGKITYSFASPKQLEVKL